MPAKDERELANIVADFDVQRSKHYTTHDDMRKPSCLPEVLFISTLNSQSAITFATQWPGNRGKAEAERAKGCLSVTVTVA